MKTILLISSLVLALNAYSLEKVRLQLNGKTQFEFAGFIAAKEKGFYKDEGIDVEILEYTPSTDTILDLENAKTTFALSDSSIILEVAKGKKLVALMSIYQNSPYVLMSLKSSNITTLPDINNKIVALNNDMNGRAVDSILKMNNVNIHKVAITNELLQLQNGVADLAVGYLSNEPYMAKKMGMDLNLINFKDYGLNRYGDILFTLEDTVKNRSELVAKMYRASTKGFKYAFANIDEMVDLIYDKYNTQKKSKEAYYYEANALKGLLGDAEEFGRLDHAKIDNIGYVYSYMDSIKYNKENLKNFIYKSTVNQKLRLTYEESLYLKKKGKLKVCVDPNWMPFEKIKDGKYTGLTSSYMSLISKKLKTPIELVVTKTWSESLQNAKERKCDILPAVMNTPEKEKYMDFTTPYIKLAVVIATKSGIPFIESLEDVKSERLGIIKGHSLIENLKRKHIGINIVEVDSITDAFDMVERGELFGYLDHLIVINEVIQKDYSESISVSGKFNYSFLLSIATRNDEKLLLSIFNKVLYSIDKYTQQDIYNKWIKFKYIEKVDYRLIIEIIIIAFIIVLIFYYRNIRLHIEIKKRKEIESNLQEAKQDLKELNSSLEEKVEIEIQKNKKHQLIMMEQIKLAQMGEMIANIAHQWRQPLYQVNSSILVIDAVLKRSSFVNELVDSKLLEIEDLTEYMSNTIDNFQNFFNSDKEEIFFYIRKIIDQSIAIIQGALSSNFTIVEVNVDESLECKGYPLELQQVLVVLLSNANDALKIRKIENPKITIEIEDLVDTYVISISDNAGGIIADNIQQVFEPYYTTKHQSQGRGVGLYMAKMIIEEGMQGKLTLENKKNGACFSIEILKGENDD